MAKRRAIQSRRRTPDRELVKNLWNGHWALKTEEFGPGPHAAYGMILLEHLQAIRQKDGTTVNLHTAPKGTWMR